MKWSEFLVTLFCKCNYIGTWRLAQKNHSGAVFNKFACCFFGVFTYLCDFSYQSLRVFYAMFVVDSITILWYSKYIKNGLICLWLKLAKTIFHKQNTYFKRLNFFWFLQFCFFFLFSFFVMIGTLSWEITQPVCHELRIEKKYCVNMS